MDRVVTELSNNKYVFVKFGKSSSSQVRGRSFVFDIERMYTNYIDMSKARLLSSRLTHRIKRYDFIRDYVSQVEYTEEDFLMRLEISESDFLDKVTLSLSYFLTLHTICKLKPCEYGSIFERSETYFDFVKNYINYVKDWCKRKVISSEVMTLIDHIETNISCLEPMMVRNMQVMSVFEDFNYTPNRDTDTPYYLYIFIAVLVLIIVALAVYYFFFRKSKN